MLSNNSKIKRGMAGMRKRLSDFELTNSQKNLCEGLVLFHEQVKDGGCAQILFYMMGAYLDAHGILSRLRDGSDYMAQNRELWDLDAGATIQ